MSDLQNLLTSCTCLYNLDTVHQVSLVMQNRYNDYISAILLMQFLSEELQKIITETISDIYYDIFISFHHR